MQQTHGVWEQATRLGVRMQGSAPGRDWQLSEQLSNMEARLAPEPEPEVRMALRSSSFMEAGGASEGGASKEVSAGHKSVVGEAGKSPNGPGAAKLGAREHAPVPKDDIYLQVTPRTTDDTQVAHQTRALYNEDLEQRSLLTAFPRSDKASGANLGDVAPANPDCGSAESAGTIASTDVGQTRAATGNPFAHFALPNPFGLRALGYMALDRLQSAIAPNRVRYLHVLSCSPEGAIGRPAQCTHQIEGGCGCMDVAGQQ